MTLELCTLFDENYLPRGLALYRSLVRVGADFRLRVLCLDAATERTLRALALPNLEAIPLADLERHDPALAGVKPDRTPVEYFWTATPALCLFCLERGEIDAITYLDADLEFHDDPTPIVAGSDASVLITPHQYAPRWRHLEEESGTYNVQFLTFRNDERGIAALRWWRDRCLEWCYARVEDGKMGDQKYLDDWPERFEGVEVLRGVRAGLAPWNAESFHLEERDGALLADGERVVFYHFHSLRLYRGITALRRRGLFRSYRLTRGAVDLVWTSYPLTADERRLVWEPYLHRLAAEIAALGPGFRGGFVPVRPLGSVARAARFRLAAAARRLLARRSAATGWQRPDVAVQMGELAEAGLRDPDAVPPFRVFLEAVEPLLERESPERPFQVLDFGCGTGHYVELLERRFPGRIDYVGCDASEAMVAAARERWPDREFVVNDVFRNRLDLGRFDLVFASALVDVVDRPAEALDVLLGSGARFVLLHRQRMTEGAPRVDVVPAYAGQQAFASYLGFDALDELAARHGRRIVARYELGDGIWSFVLERS